MNRDNLYQLHMDICDNALDLMKKKNQDYACSDDPFKNFRQYGPIGILIRLSDKLARHQSYLEKGFHAVENESLMDTTEDIINYTILFYAYVSSLKAQEPYKPKMIIPDNMKSCLKPAIPSKEPDKYYKYQKHPDQVLSDIIDPTGTFREELALEDEAANPLTPEQCAPKTIPAETLIQGPGWVITFSPKLKQDKLEILRKRFNALQNIGFFDV